MKEKRVLKRPRFFMHRQEKTLKKRIPFLLKKKNRKKSG